MKNQQWLREWREEWENEREFRSRFRFERRNPENKEHSKEYCEKCKLIDEMLHDLYKLTGLFERGYRGKVETSCRDCGECEGCKFNSTRFKVF